MANKRKSKRRKPRPKNKPSQAPVVQKKQRLLPAAPAPERTVSEGIALGGLGLAELKLTAAEEAVLAERVPRNEVEIMPHGAVYLSHPTYTRWLNRAFGRTGWALVPAAKFSKDNNSITCPYILYIHRQPVALAVGEQDYFDTNRDQSYGDAIESTVASGLRRCCKCIGIGLELWDRKWARAFMQERAVRVKVEVKNRKGELETKYWWRLKTDPPFWQEKAASKGRQVPDVGNSRPPASHAKQNEPITDKQRQRLWAIANSMGRTDAELKPWLKGKYGITSTKDITRRDYDEIVRAIEAPGFLPIPTREPGEEG